MAKRLPERIVAILKTEAAERRLVLLFLAGECRQSLIEGLNQLSQMPPAIRHSQQRAARPEPPPQLVGRPGDIRAMVEHMHRQRHIAARAWQR